MSFSYMSILILLIVVVVLILVPIGIVLVVTSVRRKDDLTLNPNLAPCPDCQKLISIHAPMCPHCGRPMKN
jgi:ABC-type glycerol-3-phosphate transport system permease component